MLKYDTINELIEHYRKSLSYYTTKREMLIGDSKYCEPPLAFDLMNVDEMIQSIAGNYKRLKRLAKVSSRKLEAILI